MRVAIYGGQVKGRVTVEVPVNGRTSLHQQRQDLGVPILRSDVKGSQSRVIRLIYNVRTLFAVQQTKAGVVSTVPGNIFTYLVIN